MQSFKKRTSSKNIFSIHNTKNSNILHSPGEHNLILILQMYTRFCTYTFLPDIFLITYRKWLDIYHQSPHFFPKIHQIKTWMYSYLARFRNVSYNFDAQSLRQTEWREKTHPSSDTGLIFAVKRGRCKERKTAALWRGMRRVNERDETTEYGKECVWKKDRKSWREWGGISLVGDHRR